MVISVHQPNYLPWVGYFHKIASSDVFVFLDAVQYPRGRSVANRNRIKTPQGVQYLTVPISIPKGREGKVSYLEVQFADPRWRNRHLKALRMAYGRAPYFEWCFEGLASIVEQDLPFAEMNIALVHYFMERLGITTPTYRLSEMQVQPARKSRLIVNICLALGVDTYLSGEGARDYNDEALFAAHGIRLVYQQFRCPEYPQLFGEFVPNLSIVDLLFNCGPRSLDILLGEGRT